MLTFIKSARFSFKCYRTGQQGVTAVMLVGLRSKQRLLYVNLVPTTQLSSYHILAGTFFLGAALSFDGKKDIKNKNKFQKLFFSY